MYTIGILAKEPVWEEKLSVFSGDSHFRLSGSIPTFDPGELISSVVFLESDVIWIPAYSDGAFLCAVQAVKFSKHVIFGFPLSKFPEEVCPLVHLAKEARVHVQLGHHELYYPAFRALRNKVQQPQYIDLSHNTGLCGDDFGSALFNALLSDVGLCISLVPDALKKFQSHTTYICEGSPPIINVRIEFNNGTAASIRLDPYASGRGINISVFQRKGILRVDLHKGLTKVESFTGTGIAGHGTVKTIWPQNDYPAPAINEDDPGFITGECLSFIHNLNKNLPPLSGLDQGCEALKICRNIFSKISVISC